MKLTVKEPMKIEDGRHEGVITGVEYREKPYEYTDLVIEFEEGKKLKYGVPTMLTPVSKLGKLMTLFGAVLDINTELDPADTFVGKKCSFMTMTEGSFANVVKDSVKPL